MALLSALVLLVVSVNGREQVHNNAGKHHAHTVDHKGHIKQHHHGAAHGHAAAPSPQLMRRDIAVDSPQLHQSHQLRPNAMIHAAHPKADAAGDEATAHLSGPEAKLMPALKSHRHNLENKIHLSSTATQNLSEAHKASLLQSDEEKNTPPLQPEEQASEANLLQSDEEENTEEDEERRLQHASHDSEETLEAALARSHRSWASTHAAATSSANATSQAASKPGEPTCGADKMGRCGPCLVDGKPESQQGGSKGDARLCLAGVCTKLCDISDSQTLIANPDCPKEMNMNDAKFQEFQTANCKAKSACFPGNAQVRVRGRGLLSPIGELRPHDDVLVQSSSGTLVYESVLGFLHALPASGASYLAVKHELGELRVSEDHLVFVDGGSTGRIEKAAANLRVGDKLFAATADEDNIRNVLPSAVLSVARRDGKNLGMYAPLTASGTIIVDGTVASNYAGLNGLTFPHCAVHALFFPLRAYHWLRLAMEAWLPSGFGSQNEEVPVPWPTSWGGSFAKAA